MNHPYKLYQRREINFELIQYFIEHGPDDNNECEDNDGYTYTPIYALCQMKKKINYEHFNYFIEHFITNEQQIIILIFV